MASKLIVKLAEKIERDCDIDAILKHLKELMLAKIKKPQEVLYGLCFLTMDSPGLLEVWKERLS